MFQCWCQIRCTKFLKFTNVEFYESENSAILFEMLLMEKDSTILKRVNLVQFKDFAKQNQYQKQQETLIFASSEIQYLPT